MGSHFIRNKKVLVTGASGGIGFAIASRFARRGSIVVLAGRNQAKLDEALANLPARCEQPPPNPNGEQPPPPISPLAHAPPMARTHSTHRFDVRDIKGWKDVVAAHKDIDILVNCAGQAQHSLLLRTSEESVLDVVASNLNGVIWGCKTVGKQMISRRSGGCIINVSSLLAYKAAVGTSVYAASKAAQLGLTTALSQELGHHGVRVNALVPGYIDTDMTKDLAKKNELLKVIPLGRFGNPSEVAHAVTFLAENQYANNCILNLDGGLSAV